jgi:hypothetical protein
MYRLGKRRKRTSCQQKQEEILLPADKSLPVTSPTHAKSWHPIEDVIKMGYGLDGRGSIPGRDKVFLFFIASRQGMGPTQPPIQWLPGNISPAVTRVVREAHHSPPSNAEDKNCGSIRPLPLLLLGIVLNQLSTWTNVSLLFCLSADHQFTNYLFTLLHQFAHF